MKVKVISVFRDKYTDKKYKLDDELEVTKERFQEIKQFVEIIKIKKK